MRDDSGRGAHDGPGVTVAVMARAPVAGRCKTRLAPALGPGGAAGLYDAMLRDSLDAYARLGVARRVVLAAPEDDGCVALRAIASSAWEVVPQVGEDLGARLASAMRALTAGGAALLLVGSDAPTVPFASIDAALAGLSAPRRALIGPCLDGGYYALGVSEPELGLLEGIAWSTPAVLAETRSRARSLGLALAELPVAYDVDEPADLERLAADLRADPSRAPRVAAFLDRRAGASFC